MSSSNDTDRDRLKGKLSNVLCNAMNYPEAVQTRILGQDLGPLLDKATDAILTEFLPGHDERVKAEGWDEGALYMNERSWQRQRILDANPYRRAS